MEIKDIINRIKTHFLTHDMSCSECVEKFEKAGLQMYDDYSDCSKCPSNSNNDSCIAQKSVNFKRMVKLIMKIEELK